MHRFTVYSPLHAWKKGDIPLDPSVSLSLNTYSEEITATGKFILISHGLTSEEEINKEIDKLKNDLDALSKMAKHELHRLKDKMYEKRKQ